MADIAVQLRRDRAGERIAGENDVTGRHAAVAAANDDAVAVRVEPQRTRILEDRGAGRFGRLGQPARKTQRMQMSAAGIEARRGIDRRAQFLFGLVRIHHPRGGIVVQAIEMRGVFGQCARRCRIVRRDNEPGFQIAGDGMLRDTLLHQRLGFFREVPQVARVNGAQPLLELRLILALARMNLPAVAAGRGITHGFGFEERHARAALRQMQRGRNAGVPPADHADVSPGRTRKRRARRGDSRARGVVALWLIGGHFSSFPRAIRAVWRRPVKRPGPPS